MNEVVTLREGQERQKQPLTDQELQDIREAYPHRPRPGLENWPRESLYSAIYHRERAIQELLDHIDLLQGADA